MPRHTHRFSHDINEGPSGPARSYWDIDRNGCRVITICLHHRRTIEPVMQADAICRALDDAFEAGRKDKARELRDVLEISK